MSNGKDGSLTETVIGIIGCGHLGRALAGALLANGFLPENLLVSHGGSPATLERLKKAGLTANITTNTRIAREADLIFITLRPQEFKELARIPFSERAVIVSGMAGVYRKSFQKIPGNAWPSGLIRIMLSGPETIKSGRGIVGVYPRHALVNSVLTKLGLTVYQLPDEEALHFFTVGVCLPAALLAAPGREAELDEAVRIFGAGYPGFKDIRHWAATVLPDFESADERLEYLAGMVTAGGVTEAIITSLNSGAGFTDALRNGLSHSRELADRANRSLAGV